jgi:[ribosomal protein S5]-alanine N-acetyltransferase
MPHKNFTPFPALKTERLILRQLVSSDDKDIFALRSDKNVNKYLNRKPCMSIDDANNFIQAINENIQRNDSVYWAITFNGIDKLIGTICLFNFTEDNLKAELGFELLPDFQQKGIMQEAASTVIDFAIRNLGLNSIQGYTHSENQSSIRLLKKLNFQRLKAEDDNFITMELTHPVKRKNSHPLTTVL